MVYRVLKIIAKALPTSTTGFFALPFYGRKYTCLIFVDFDIPLALTVHSGNLLEDPLITATLEYIHDHDR